MHAIRVASPGGSVDLVLRRYVWQRFLDEETDRPGHEAAILASLSGTPVPAPELIAIDPAGTVCDVPALLMTRLPGRTFPHPDDWLARSAVMLADIHRVDGSGLEYRYRPYCADHELRPPAWGDPGLWNEALAVVAASVPADQAFIHRDYHPGNLLWERSELGGVVDWLAACLGPSGVDVAHLGVNLVLDYGAEAVRVFRHAYEKASGTVHPSRYDVIGAVDSLPFYEGTADLDGWPDGAPDAVARRQRLESFLAGALAGI